MDILMSETCWAHNKWNKITSDIKLVFHSSTCIFLCLQPQAGFDEQLSLPWTANVLETAWLHPDKVCNVNRSFGTRALRYYVTRFNLIHFKVATHAIFFRRRFLVLGLPYMPRWLGKVVVSSWHPGHCTCFGRCFRPLSAVQDCTYSNQRDTAVCLLASRQQYLFDKCLLLYIQSWTADDGRKDRPKHVECHSKIK